MLNDPAFERSGVEAAAQGIGPHQGSECLTVPDHTLRAVELAHWPLRHGHLADRLHPGAAHLEQLGHLEIGGRPDQSTPDLISVDRRGAVGPLLGRPGLGALQ